VPGTAISVVLGAAVVTLGEALPEPLNALGLINVFATGGEPLPRAFAGDHRVVESGGGLGETALPEAGGEGGWWFSFVPSDTTEEPPAEWEGGFAVNNGPVIASAEDDEVHGSAVITDLRNRELVIMALIDRAFVYQPGLPLRTVAYPEGVTLLPGQRVELLQYLNKVFIFRGSLIDGAENFNHPALVWNMVFSNEAGDQFRVVPQGAHPSGEPDLARMPAADWAVAFNRQLILPFGRDQLILSDFGDADSFNILSSQIRILPGGNDWLAGAGQTHLNFGLS
jgi:hypothetical protein